MDKNNIIGLLLITAILIGFSIYNRPTKEQIAAQQRLRDSLALVEQQRAEERQLSNLLEDEVDDLEQQSSAADFFAAADESTEFTGDSIVTLPLLEKKAETVTLENEKVRIELSTLGGSIHTVQLKEYLHHTRDSLYLFSGDEARFNLDIFNRNSVRLSTENEYFIPIREEESNRVTMRLQSTPEQFIDFIYTLPEDEYMMDFEVRVGGMKNALHPESLTNFRMYWEQDIRQQEKGRKFENRFARIHYKYDRQDVKKMSESKNDRKELSEPLKWFAFKDQYFSAIIIGKRPFSNTILSSKILNEGDHIKSYAAEVWVPGEISTDRDLITAGFNYYFGPVHYNTLKAYDKGVSESSDKLHLQETVYLGYRWLSWVNKWFVIPVFNFFLSLDWGMGVIIMILTLMVKLVISPLTYKSYISSAKMRVLRPQIQELEKKYPGNDQDMMLKRQQATMELYNKVGVSPMSGCMPMLIQMPVLMALFFFFPSAIELRQQGFLWADDLSTYDSLISWSGNIPFITNFLGNHISIFCLLMTTVNVIYARYNMNSMDTGQQSMSGMKYMPIFMSVFMFFFLNSYPAGLTYYYFLSTLVTIGLTLFMKMTISEDKILAELEANKKKPKKKSGFMARLEEAQKLQEKQARERARENAKRRYR